jgi:methylenetetrahydrofolate dehydrogenase (NADP+)/methenyltetrahydrofolate cyclohydrolase
MALLRHYNIGIAGKTACVVGRSAIVGKPMAALLVNADATVITVHSKTPSLRQFTQQADVLIVAAGKPGLISAPDVKAGAVVVDVGIHRSEDGSLRGDVDYDSVSSVASAITPVPGGVGPMTIAVLLQNTVLAARRLKGLSG